MPRQAFTCSKFEIAQKGERGEGGEGGGGGLGGGGGGGGGHIKPPPQKKKQWVLQLSEKILTSKRFFLFFLPTLNELRPAG